MKTEFYDRVNTIKYSLTDGSISLQVIIVENNDISPKWDVETQWEGYAKDLVLNAYHCGLDWEKAEIIMPNEENNIVVFHIVTVWRENGFTTHEIKYL